MFEFQRCHRGDVSTVIFNFQRRHRGDVSTVIFNFKDATGVTSLL